MEGRGIGRVHTLSHLLRHTPAEVCLMWWGVLKDITGLERSLGVVCLASTVCPYRLHSGCRRFFLPQLLSSTTASNF